MKLTKKIALAAVAIAATGAANGQQLTNNGFEEEWVKCVPYTFYGAEGYEGVPSEVVVGEKPAGWNISNVAGMAGYDEQEGPMGLGATTVGAKVEGFQSVSAVQLTNTPNPFMAAQIVPAYLTLGTSWSTAMPGFGATGIVINNSDGGAFGGVPFTARPKSLEFMYKRSRGTAKPDEVSTVVAYLWKGHWTQKDVSTTIVMVGEPYKVDMVDRDRCVLGMDMTACQGGEVTKSDDAELIGKLTATITESTDEWVKFSADFEYFSDATPEMLNIVIAAGDYFGGADVVGNGNSLTVDDVRLIYADEPADNALVYNGTLSIDLSELDSPEPIVMDGQSVKIKITGENTCDFLLENFILEGLGNLGNIEVEGVSMTKNSEGVTSYSGRVDGLELMDKQITANVDVNGTEDADHNLTMKIDVLWTDAYLNIPVTFNGKLDPSSAGITDITVDGNAVPRYFLINGLEVKEAPASGLYIELRGNKARKVLVK